MITNEHVVAMMKAAISETEDIPLFVSKKGFQLFQMHRTFPSLSCGMERIGGTITDVLLPLG